MNMFLRVYIYYIYICSYVYIRILYIYVPMCIAPTGPPINVMVVEMTSTTATLAFSPPQYLDQNGRITLYILSYFKEGEEPRQLINRTYPSLGRAVERVTIMNLDPDSVYLYTITAVNSAGIGVPSFEKRFRTLSEYTT